ncbi:hypothetical protein L2E82_04448 [Cichorium intybus]|uniref:Uncharacterized protein n=1 Tax=Cichorium intybus TaxID=13427 RepID=A0ACB9H5G1_CICIN|nr:hypothetical protein L2E82_04448 [Cichorium intybus]
MLDFDSQRHRFPSLHELFTSNRFFITSSVLDLTIVGLNVIDEDSNASGQQSHYLKICSKPTLDLGSSVYLLGYTEKNKLTVGEGKLFSSIRHRL